MTEITGILAIRSEIPLENIWSEFIESRKYTSVFAKGLGANDNEGHTHLQAAYGLTEKVWRQLPEQLPKTRISLSSSEFGIFH